MPLLLLQAWYMHPAFSVLIGGILPFGAVFIELFFILTSMWLHQFYYLFGFLCLVFVILIITCAEITIVLCYFQLCSEDYHWWCAPSASLQCGMALFGRPIALYRGSRPFWQAGLPVGLALVTGQARRPDVSDADACP